MSDVRRFEAHVFQTVFADVEQTLFAVLIGKGRMIPAVDFALADPNLLDVFDQRFVIFSRIAVRRLGRDVVRKIVRILERKELQNV